MREFPTVRGLITPNRSLKDLTWLRVGGPALALYQPLDVHDLQLFLRELKSELDIFPIGLGSNLIVRDGGIDAVVIRLGGKAFNYIKSDNQYLICGAAALDSRVAINAAELGFDLTFMRTIPGCVGGAVVMNAGCYGDYVSSSLTEVTFIDREGRTNRWSGEKMNFGYRSSALPMGSVVVEAIFRPTKAKPEDLLEKMEKQLRNRNETQPRNERTAGSTFRNPSGFSSLLDGNEADELKAWKLIENSGFRGFELGGAKVSNKHPNFLINTGDATSADLENLGELIRKNVLQKSGILLEWEVIRVGKKD
ncbi:MAG: UDP-N-acetylmuramate dehydrogenase [Proteobacteria bacterium]|jgi:UDP-N-acetylmuramate dehydrogenase|nr:UDP-N-acetylmuramate dehydrogenase [Pseudomonadota bacterium]MDA1237765.1 UDP-N-acetylmuramate dehydrogenase [Pseudomonadota bacterium]